MTDEQEVPDVYNPADECGAWRQQPAVIGATPHHHVCRRNPDHQPPHRCHSCGATWTLRTAVA